MCGRERWTDFMGRGYNCPSHPLIFKNSGTHQTPQTTGWKSVSRAALEWECRQRSGFLGSPHRHGGPRTRLPPPCSGMLWFSTVHHPWGMARSPASSVQELPVRKRTNLVSQAPAGPAPACSCPQVPACSLSCPFHSHVSRQGKYKLVFTLVLEKQTQKVSSFHSSGRPRELAWMMPCFSGQMHQCRRHLPP